MEKIRVVRMLVSCTVAMCLIAFMYFINHKMETLQSAEYVSSAGLYLIVFIVFVFAINEVYRLLNFFEKKVPITLKMKKKTKLFNTALLREIENGTDI